VFAFEKKYFDSLGYNGKYEKIITEELPKYLGRESRKEKKEERKKGDDRTFVE
jgi:hypothetical protein